MSILSGHSHSFDTGIAKSLGVNAAIVFNHIVYWLRYNSSNENAIHEEKVWMYETQKKMAEFLEYMTLEEVKKAVVKLLEAKLLIKANFNKNPFDKTAWYTTTDQNIISIKKTLTKAPYSAIGSAIKRDPRRPTAPCIYKVNKEQLKEQQHTESAAASFKAFDPDEPSDFKIYDCLNEIDLTLAEKVQISSTLAEEDVKYGVQWVKSCKKPRQSIGASITWAAKHRPTIPIPKEEIEVANRKFAKKYDDLKNSVVHVQCSPSYVMFAFVGNGRSVSIDYDDIDFKHKLLEQLKKCRLI